MLFPENSFGYNTPLLVIRSLFQFVLVYWAWMNRKLKPAV